MTGGRPVPILIHGPTGAGKSALALALAERFGGAVVNADALQVYAEWRVLTARPGDDDLARAPHLLYGHVPAARAYSVGDWLRDLDAALRRCATEGLRPVVVGGTGLYFRAALKGLAEIPQPSPELRAAAEARLARLGRQAFAGEIARRDPDTAARIDLANPARLLRAWETLEASGEGLAAHWARMPPPLIRDAVRLRIEPDRARLYAVLDARFDAMMARGALDEARAAMALNLPDSAPAMKAIGAVELISRLRGEISLRAAVLGAKQATRNYAKRQSTWGRNQMADWTALPGPDVDAAIAAAAR